MNRALSRETQAEIYNMRHKAHCIETRVLILETLRNSQRIFRRASTKETSYVFVIIISNPRDNTENPRVIE
jgi:hypothetical protein